jgi:hypothetical protein
MATWSLLMVGASAAAALIAGAVGTFLQLVVFDLEEHELLSEAGAWGHAAGFGVLALMLIPALVGIVFGVRGRQLGERRLGTAVIGVNAFIAAYLVVTAASGLLLG